MLAITIAIASFAVIMFIPILFPIKDEEVKGFVCHDPKFNSWSVYLTNRVHPMAFSTEEEAQAFLTESITHRAGGQK